MPEYNLGDFTLIQVDFPKIALFDKMVYILLFFEFFRCK
jgi:hypothetical protein